MITDFPLDFARFRKINRPNQCLALPAGFQSVQKPDIISGVFTAHANDVQDCWLEILRSAPRVSNIRQADGQIEAMQRTALIGFPDWITAQAVDLGDGKASICVFSRSKYGMRDFGVNHNRVSQWLAALAAKLPLQS
jgi:uncharacterized protein (DUF1499 family)